MEQRHFVQVETIWKDILLATEQPDSGWIWDYKLHQSQQQERYEAYALEVDDLTQGLIFLETQWHRSQLPGRWPLVYVEAIASAPWNRITIEQPPWLRGIGRRLLAFARVRSVELGYGGRVGLHSLPDVEGFYEQQSMPNYGPDDEKEGLVYFEYGVIQ
ncbi:MAG: hypothetical protein AAFV72_24730 [Cyanobacteria bacterium J06635_1]